MNNNDNKTATGRHRAPALPAQGRSSLRVLAIAMALLLSTVGGAWAEAVTPANCLGCHAQNADQPVHAILQTSHGRISQGGNKGCISCHGDSDQHGAEPLQVAPAISYGPRWPSPPEEQVSSCLNCHRSGKQMLWTGSAHDDEDLTCTSCHQLHVQRDALLDERTQADTCYQCHPRQRTQANLPYRHPIKEGRTTCSDCHNSHGSSTEFALVEPTLNDTCYQCHAEKRGPYLFEHAPSAEDCSLCHAPHGSVNDDLLTARGPFLCQQCHSAAFHPSTLYNGSGLPGASPNQNMLGKNCLNCHSQVHGSNHPSGAVLTR